MKPQYSFVKPKECVSYTIEEKVIAKKCNDIGADSWTKGISDQVGFVRGDIKKRNDLKLKIKSHLTLAQQEYCYYCGRSFDFFRKKVNVKKSSANIHIDHILPKNAPHGNYNSFVFEPHNLILACNICNGFDFKGVLDFAKEPKDEYSNIEFLIIHPYFDDISEHFRIDENTGVVEKIYANTSKAEYMIDIFGINDEFTVLNRLGSIAALKKKLSNKDEKNIEVLIMSIPLNGVTTKI